ncbi:hypothetical protein [Tengunoibacter tsumagoiensis]|uniref:Glycosyltransferase RgtA/B/C/D-like domain-containing protein n=1 Tax=Tengunoibacter tsumagoiensis TaxID=2014871 RepID=A0A401ZUC3_9CHLR|nr:hypothetical protein [Tengunoibacter tsumagoiensis]GCE10471.1 hypothetical protein KTT_03300 [Tengunoibacter tsumagoiensis]
MGTICLILGNFFYIYLHLFGCVRRYQYSLVKWALTIPIYWLLMSAAGMRALFQLFFKPHHWEKTIHGLHLQAVLSAEESAPSVAHLPAEGTSSIAHLSGENTHSIAHADLLPVDDSEMTETPGIPVTELKLTPLPRLMNLLPPRLPAAFSNSDRRALNRPAVLVRDLWLLSVILLASIASVIASIGFFMNSETLIYDDAYSHIRIARSMVDSITPGFAQLGGVWLPLHHLLMVPFIWNDTLWRTGFAGSIPSMSAYILGCAYLFLLIRQLTHNNMASFIGTLVMLLNPDLLYLQSTALSEIECVSAVLFTFYYVLRWVQEDQTRDLVLMAFGILLVSLIRYDGWSLFIILFALVAVIGVWKRHGWKRIEANLILFGLMGSLGMAIWLAWCKMIFGDPLYFQRGPYSAQAQQMKFLAAHTLYTYHNVWQSVRYYGLDSLESIGGLLFLLGWLSALFFFLRYRFTPVTLAVATFLTPFAFYCYSLYSGQAILYLPGALPPGAPPQYFNVRYGSEMVAPLAFFLGVGLAHLPIRHWLRKWRGALYVLCILLIVGQALYVGDGRNLALNDGLYNHSCSSTSRPIHVFLSQHYNGNFLLTDEYTTQVNGQVFGAQLRKIIYEGSDPYWSRALAAPQQIVDWIIMRPKDTDDLVAKALAHNDAFLDNFTLVLTEKDGLSLYLRNDINTLPSRPVPLNILNNEKLCQRYGGYTY